MGHSQSIPDTTDLNLLCIKYTFSENQFAFIPTYPQPQERPKIDQRTWQDCRSAQRWATHGWVTRTSAGSLVRIWQLSVQSFRRNCHRWRSSSLTGWGWSQKKVDQPRATLVNDVKANRTTVTKITTFNTLHIETLQRSKFPPWLCGRSYKLRRRTFPPLYIDYCRQRKRLTILK